HSFPNHSHLEEHIFFRLQTVIKDITTDVLRDFERISKNQEKEKKFHKKPISPYIFKLPHGRERSKSSKNKK
ncbi:MAG: hypothetical protein ACXABG_15045, partial [Promethearchaeota archaeon]